MFGQEKRQNRIVKTIAVKAIDRGLGATHVSLCLANALALTGGRVAMIEWNSHRELEEIEKIFSGFGYEDKDKQVFRIRRVDYYKSYQEKGMASLKKENYDFVIADIGSQANSYFAEADYPLLIVSGSEWKAARALDEIKKLEEVVGSRLKVIVNFGVPEELAFFRKKYQGEIYAFPFWKDPFASQKEQREWIGQMFQY